MEDVLMAALIYWKDQSQTIIFASCSPHTFPYLCVFTPSGFKEWYWEKKEKKEV